MKKKTVMEVLGEVLTRCRVDAHMSTQQLAEKLYGKGTKNRPYIEEVESGRKNMTFRKFEKMIEACDQTAEKALAGLNESDLPKGFHQLYWMLGVIVESGKDKFIDGITLNLQAISEKVLRETQPTKKGSGRITKGSAPAAEKKKQQPSSSG